MRYSAEKLWAKIDKRSPDECWLWTAATNSGGYGHVRIGGRAGHNITATRLMVEMLGVEIPPGFDVCHTCDNRRCVNPKHLWLGTRSQNIQDMHDKGRGFSLGRTITHCPKAHEYTVENTYYSRSNKQRHCRECTRQIRRKRTLREKLLRLSKVTPDAAPPLEPPAQPG